ncbi:DinB family protein [Pseudarthrobacter sp. J64]|uniref:DinB family protein n=1 Tax=Pseudarthrobacter sp. J64 TaxID=3116485 RepID=UPI002E80B3D4|nr:DinB family protein [Pseudarthrobacter sp. J64]MEE2570251.1 DinB family protein [Pseudarthrobacter sp. J64]
MDPGTEAILADYNRARRELATWLAAASAQDLRRRSNGTRWTNGQLLFHMVFGYMVVRALLPLVRIVSRLPRPLGTAFAALLNAGTRPFDVVNYWGSCAAATVYNRNRMARKLDRTIESLARQLERETPESLALTMAFPDRWDPFFSPTMTLNEVYAYPTLHFDFHAQQLSLH